MNKNFLTYFLIIEFVLILIGIIFFYLNSICLMGDLCIVGLTDIIKSFSLPIFFGFLTPIFFYLWNKKRSNKKIMINSIIIVIIITIGIFASVELINYGKDFIVTGNIVYDEPETYLNLSNQNVEKYSCISELVKNKEVEMTISNNEFSKIDDFFKENNHPLGDITYFKNNEEFFCIKFDRMN